MLYLYRTLLLSKYFPISYQYFPWHWGKFNKNRAGYYYYYQFTDEAATAKKLIGDHTVLWDRTSSNSSGLCSFLLMELSPIRQNFSTSLPVILCTSNSLCVSECQTIVYFMLHVRKVRGVICLLIFRCLITESLSLHATGYLGIGEGGWEICIWFKLLKENSPILKFKLKFIPELSKTVPISDF